VTRDPLADAEAHYNLGVLLTRESNGAGGMTEYERALAMNPNHAQALNNLGVAWDARADHKKALDYFKRASEADPTFTEAFFNLGWRTSGSRQREGDQSVRAGASSSSRATPSRTRSGRCTWRRASATGAVEAFKKSIELTDAQEADASKFRISKKYTAKKRTAERTRLAMAYIGLGRKDEAVAR